MLEEAGQVVEVRDQFAWIETAPKTACTSCSVRSGCGTSVLAKLLGRRYAPVRVINRIGAAVGDRLLPGQLLLQGFGPGQGGLKWIAVVAHILFIPCNYSISQA